MQVTALRFHAAGNIHACHVRVFISLSYIPKRKEKLQVRCLEKTKQQNAYHLCLQEDFLETDEFSLHELGKK